MFHRDLVRQTASASTIPPGTGFPPRFEKRAASVGVGVPNWIVESKIDNDDSPSLFVQLTVVRAR